MLPTSSWVRIHIWAKRRKAGSAPLQKVEGNRAPWVPSSTALFQRGFDWQRFNSTTVMLKSANLPNFNCMIWDSHVRRAKTGSMFTINRRTMRMISMPSFPQTSEFCGIILDYLLIDFLFCLFSHKAAMVIFSNSWCSFSKGIFHSYIHNPLDTALFFYYSLLLSLPLISKFFILLLFLNTSQWFWINSFQITISFFHCLIHRSYVFSDSFASLTFLWLIN